MADGKRGHDWDQSSMVIAKIHNMHIANSSDAISASSIHPYMRDEGAPAETIVPVSKELQMNNLKALGGLK